MVENELYRITFSNRGGQVTSWILKKYKDDAGKPLDLVNAKAAAKVGYPLSLWTYDANLRNQLVQALYVPSASGTLNAPATLAFTYSENGLEVKKVFSFDSTYVVHVDVTATDHGSPVTALVAWPGGFGDQDTLPDYAQSQFDTMQGGKNENQAAKKIAGGGTIPGPFEWAGVSDLSFAAIFLPDDAAANAAGGPARFDRRAAPRQTGPDGPGVCARAPRWAPLRGTPACGYSPDLRCWTCSRRCALRRMAGRRARVWNRWWTSVTRASSPSRCSWPCAGCTSISSPTGAGPSWF